MPAPQTPEEICEPIEEEQPREEKMPAPSHGETAMSGKGRPPWEATLLVSFGRIAAETKHSRGVEVISEQSGDPLDAVLGLNRLHCKDRLIEIRCLAEVKRRMGVEDLQPAH